MKLSLMVFLGLTFPVMAFAAVANAPTTVSGDSRTDLRNSGASDFRITGRTDMRNNTDTNQNSGDLTVGDNGQLGAAGNIDRVDDTKDSVDDLNDQSGTFTTGSHAGTFTTGSHAGTFTTQGQDTSDADSDQSGSFVRRSRNAANQSDTSGGGVNQNGSVSTGTGGGVISGQTGVQGSSGNNGMNPVGATNNGIPGSRSALPSRNDMHLADARNLSAHQDSGKRIQSSVLEGEILSLKPRNDGRADMIVRDPSGKELTLSLNSDQASRFSGNAAGKVRVTYVTKDDGVNQPVSILHR